MRVPGCISDSCRFGYTPFPSWLPSATSCRRLSWPCTIPVFFCSGGWPSYVFCSFACRPFRCFEALCWGFLFAALVHSFPQQTLLSLIVWLVRWPPFSVFLHRCSGRGYSMLPRVRMRPRPRMASRPVSSLHLCPAFLSCRLYYLLFFLSLAAPYYFLSWVFSPYVDCWLHGFFCCVRFPSPLRPLLHAPLRCCLPSSARARRVRVYPSFFSQRSNFRPARFARVHSSLAQGRIMRSHPLLRLLTISSRLWLFLSDVCGIVFLPSPSGPRRRRRGFRGTAFLPYLCLNARLFAPFPVSSLLTARPAAAWLSLAACVSRASRFPPPVVASIHPRASLSSCFFHLPFIQGC